MSYIIKLNRSVSLFRLSCRTRGGDTQRLTFFIKRYCTASAVEFIKKDLKKYFLGYNKKHGQDRQTDMATTVKSNWWSVTAYNDEIELLIKAQNGDLETPPYVKEIHGGIEECPTTKRQHFQGALRTDSIRMSQLKKWLPTAHLEKARRHEALVAYALKAETAVGEKQSSVLSTHMSPDKLVCQLIEFRYHHITERLPTRGSDLVRDYHTVVNRFIQHDFDNRRRLMSMLADPRTHRIYKTFACTLHELYHQSLHEPVFSDDESDG